MRWFRQLNGKLRIFLTSAVWLTFLIYNSFFDFGIISIILLLVAMFFGILFIIIEEQEEKIWRAIHKARIELEQEIENDSEELNS